LDYHHLVKSALHRSSSLREGGEEDGPMTTIEMVNTLQNNCLILTYAAHAKWAQWVASHFVKGDKLKGREGEEGLERLLRKEDWADPQRWALWPKAQGSSSPSEATTTDPKAPSKISVPTQPSIFVFNFLFCVCKEIQRIAGHTLDDPVLRYLADVSLCEVMAAYKRVFVVEKKKVNKEGCVQLRFDLRFLVSILHGRREFTPLFREAINFVNSTQSHPQHQSEEPSWKEDLSLVQAAIRQQMDPIESAFYDPIINAHVERCCGRNSVLLSPLIDSFQTPSRQIRTSTDEISNVVVLAPQTTRFLPLPINALHSFIEKESQPLKNAPDANPNIENNDNKDKGAAPFVSAFSLVNRVSQGLSSYLTQEQGVPGSSPHFSSTEPQNKQQQDQQDFMGDVDGKYWFL